MLTGPESEESRWIGMGFTIKDKKKKVLHFESFANGPLVIKKFDHVMINSGKTGGSGTERCFVAKVLDFYDKGNGKDDRHRAVVEWYFRPGDMKKFKKVKMKTFNDKCEVITYRGKKFCGDDIDAESIFGVCRVVTVSENEEFQPRSDDGEEPVFFTRWCFDGENYTALKPDEEESECTVNTARRCLFDSAKKSERKTNERETKNENKKTKSPFKNFYPSTEKRKAVTDEREAKKRKLDNEPSTKGKRKLFGEEKDASKSPAVEKNLRNSAKKSKSDDRFEQARRSLHVSMLPTRLPCRENEYKEIYTFVKGKLQVGSNGCVYISGVPGSGKTATVMEVMKNLTDEKENGDVCDFQFVALNGMKMTDPHEIYVQIVKELMDQKMSAQYAIDYLNKQFGKWRKEHVVLLVDELDLLYTKRQDVLYNLFEWPSRPKARLIVIAVANTMNLPERIMSNRVVSRVGMARITFQPYTFQQLEEIIKARLSELQTFKPDAVRLVARKVGAVSGDARRALDICRRATEIADGSNDAKQCVGVSHVDKALQEMFSSPKFMAIQNASVNEQMLLRVIAKQFEHSGVEECSWGDVYPNLVSLCRLEGISVPNESQACGACFQLASCRLIIAENGCKDRQQRIRLNVSTEDVAFALDCKL